jgi:hypothetical protein
MSLEPNLDNIRAWVEALESGDFAQGRAVLRIVDESTGHPKYCCLGVATFLALQADPNIMPDGGYYANDRCLDFSQLPLPLADRKTHEHDLWCQITEEVLPLDVQRWLGIDEQDPVLWVEGHDPERDETRTASVFNDAAKEDFRMIAWRIRMRYLPEDEHVPYPYPDEPDDPEEPTK